jgi:hypothetical protein
MFQANMELALRMEESAELITAAETAPSPMKATKDGVKFCSTNGRTRRASDSCSPEDPGILPNVVLVQSKSCNCEENGVSQ